MGEIGDHRRFGIEAGRVEGDAAVLPDRDPGETDERLRDHSLRRRPLRQRGDRRQFEGRQRELCGSVGVAVRQAADACGDTTW
jgi:hypothetical protein